MFCQNCGAKLDDDAKFCTSCGTPTGDAQSPAFVPPVEEKPKAESPYQQYQPTEPQSQSYQTEEAPKPIEAVQSQYPSSTSVYQPAFTVADQPKKKKSLLWLWILIGALVVASVAFVALALFAPEGEKNYNDLVYEYFEAFSDNDVDDMVDLFNRKARLRAEAVANSGSASALLDDGGLDDMTTLYGSYISDTEEIDVLYLDTADAADVMTAYSVPKATYVADVTVRAELSGDYFNGRFMDVTFRMIKASGRWTLLSVTGKDAGYSTADDLADSYFTALGAGDIDAAAKMMSPAILAFNGIDGSASDIIDAADGNSGIYGCGIEYFEDSREDMTDAELENYMIDLGVDSIEGVTIRYSATVTIDGEEKEMVIRLSLVKIDGAWFIAKTAGSTVGMFGDWLDVVLAYYEYASIGDEEAVMSLFYPGIIDYLTDYYGRALSTSEALENELDYWYSEYGLEMQNYQVYEESRYSDSELAEFEATFSIDEIEEGGDFEIYADMYAPDGSVYYYDYDFELFKIDGSWYLIYIW